MLRTLLRQHGHARNRAAAAAAAGRAASGAGAVPPPGASRRRVLRPLSSSAPATAASDATQQQQQDDPARQAPHLTPTASTAALNPAAEPQPATQPHVPVLLNEILALLQPVDMKVYMDCTLGAGGHAVAMVKAHQEMQQLVGLDLDPMAHGIAQPRLSEAAPPGLTTHFVYSNYSNLESVLRGLPSGSLFGKVDAILMDLGVSSMQLDTAERGFSFLRDGPIDMRMDPGAKMSAEEVLNTYSEAQLGRIIREYGEEKLWRVVARRIVTARETSPIKTTQQLAQIIGHTQLHSKGKGKAKGGGGGGGGGRGVHPATRTFQALRIVVNDELGQLEQALPAAIQSLAPGGRLAVISFHSLEDRLVKHAFLRAAGRPTPEQEHLTYGEGSMGVVEEMARNAVGSLVTRKAVTAGEAETSANPRSRSAKLRVIEKRAAPEDRPAGGRRRGARLAAQQEAALAAGTIEVRATGDGRGNGAFSTAPIPQGAYLGDYEGRLLNQQQYFEQYPDGTSDFVTELDAEWHIDASDLVHLTSTFSAVHMNHSSTRANVTRLKDPAARRVSFFASRDIPAGEELLYDYGPKYWSGRKEQELP